jgi:FkbM family methyltransferase
VSFIGRGAGRARDALRQLTAYARGMAPSQMTGRTYDLRKSRRVDLGDFSLFVMPNDYIGSSILSSKAYEPHVTKQIRSILRNGDVFLDLGANLGFFTMMASSILKTTGKVIAFEPNPQNVQLIYQSMHFGKVSNVMLHPFAASDSTGIVRFVTRGSNGGIVTPHSQEQTHVFLVQAVVVDDILRSEPRIDLIKMDTEAHEPAALRGMVRLIEKHRPKIITEFHPWALRLNNPEPPEEYLRLILKLGYRMSIILPSGDLHPTSSPEQIMDYWTSLHQENIQLDLLAETAAR